MMPCSSEAASTGPSGRQERSSRKNTGSAGILPLLSNVLKTNEAEFWEPLEPDVLMAI
jgi:hypothetical protein